MTAFLPPGKGKGQINNPKTKQKQHSKHGEETDGKSYETRISKGTLFDKWRNTFPRHYEMQAAQWHTKALLLTGNKSIGIQCFTVCEQRKINKYNLNSQMNNEMLFLLKAQVCLSLQQGDKLWWPLLFGLALENSCQDDPWADSKLIIKTSPNSIFLV